MVAPFPNDIDAGTRSLIGGFVGPDLLALLRCPSCRSRLVVDRSPAGGSEILACWNCNRRVPVSDGIPRFVDTAESEAARRTQASFGYEWTHFDDWRPSGETNFNDYFQNIDLDALHGRLVLDAGCGMGRHARQIAAFAGRVVAVDFSRAIDAAARNVRDLHNVHCLQADLRELPLADATFDLVYSLGVLHHIADTDRALACLVEKLRPGGRLRIYLYWKRHGWQGAALRSVTAVRRLTTRMPLGILKALCFVLSLILYGCVVWPYRVLSTAGVSRHRDWPLFVYARYPFVVLYNDQFDRFSAPIEKRYEADEVKSLLQAAGLRDVQVRPCFGWLGDGYKPR